MNDNIKAILFDSGRVLNEPVTGHWMIPANFFLYVDKKRFDLISKTRRKQAFQKAMNYITNHNMILTEEDEYHHFFEHFKIISQELPELGLTDDKIELITKNHVYNYEKYSFFDDAMVVVPELSKSYKLAVVSDAWPSLEGVFKAAGMLRYFSAFVISSKLGVTKPDEKMYKAALAELNLSADEVVFIDDNVRNCDGAKKAGIKETYLLCRDIRLFLYYKLKCKDHIVIKNLYEIRY